MLRGHAVRSTVGSPQGEQPVAHLDRNRPRVQIGRAAISGIGGTLNRRTHRDGFATCLFTLALQLSGNAWAAQPAPSPPQAQARDRELSEVLVEGQRTKTKPPTFKQYQEPFNFLARLVGEYYVEGSVDLHAQGRSEDLRKVSGRAECVGFGMAPGVQCELRIRWPGTTGPNNEEIPGGLSTLNPAVMLFGFESADATLRPAGIGLRPQPGGAEEPRWPGISWILIDSKGIAEKAVGKMASPDTLQSRSKCTSMPGDCERVTLITAQPDLSVVDMDIDLVFDGQKSVSFLFELHRLPGSDSVVYGRKDKKAK